MPTSSFLSRVLILFLPLLSFLRAEDKVSTDPNTYGAISHSPYQTFISAPDLKPPELLVTKNEGAIADGYVFIGVNGKPDSTQNVPCIFGLCCSVLSLTSLEPAADIAPSDMSPGPRLGTLVWTGINYTQPFDFRAQTYKGEPHLTFFLGQLLDGG